MNKDELIKKLKEVNEKYIGDDEALHEETDDLLFEYLDDKEIYDLCHGFSRWCA